MRSSRSLARRRRTCPACRAPGWSGGMLSAPKLWKSSSTSGPSATEKPMRDEDVDDLVLDLPQRMEVPARAAARRQRDVDALLGERPLEAGAAPARPPCASSARGDVVLHRVGERAHGGALLRRQLAEPAQDRVQRALAAEVLHADRLERVRALGRRRSPPSAASRSCASSARTATPWRPGSWLLASAASSPNACGSSSASAARILRSTSTAGRLQARHEPAVRQPVLARRRVDADDPQAAEVALALLAVAVGVGEPALDGLAGLAIGLASAADVALRELQ